MYVNQWEQSSDHKYQKLQNICQFERGVASEINFAIIVRQYYCAKNIILKLKHIIPHIPTVHWAPQKTIKCGQAGGCSAAGLRWAPTSPDCLTPGRQLSACLARRLYTGGTKGGHKRWCLPDAMSLLKEPSPSIAFSIHSIVNLRLHVWRTLYCLLTYCSTEAEVLML